VAGKSSDTTDEQLKKLASRKSLSEEVRQDLREKIEAYKRLIHKMAHKYVRNRVEYEDLIQEALYGLALACRDFDPERSDDFHTYAIYRMKGRMYEYCIGNENPIYVPTHVAKAASYVKQMQRLLGKEPYFVDSSDLVAEIIMTREHPEEDKVPASARKELSELKRKLGNIASNSKMKYTHLATLASESLSLIVSDEILAKFPKDSGFVDELVSNRELGARLRESLGEKRFTVLVMRKMGWNLREIAEHLEALGYTNKKGQQISRQAVKAILDETLRAVSRMRIFRELRKDTSTRKA
jgi:RNA polymerase sigma factor (sigma-70 family)